MYVHGPIVGPGKVRVDRTSLHNETKDGYNIGTATLPDFPAAKPRKAWIMYFYPATGELTFESEPRQLLPDERIDELEQVIADLIEIQLGVI